MKKIFYLSIIGIILFEIANVYFIMPMPGSQEMKSIDIAYFLYHWRWIFRILFIALAFYTLGEAFSQSKIFPVVALLIAAGIAYVINTQMAADSMFLNVKDLQLKNVADSKVETNRLIIGVEYNGQAKAYPIQYLGYHHQVFDSIAGKKIIVTYCTVCRTGRVFEPIVNGQTESFRLVGMDHFNAMFEDKATKSWWRQATGEAIAGKLKGQKLPEVHYTQMELKGWLALHPNSLIMQPDKNFVAEYDGMKNYEAGKSKGGLTKRDTAAWQRKSWIVGIVVGNESKAYDWMALEKQRVINDVIGSVPIVLVLANDNKSFFAFERKNDAQQFTLSNDTLKSNQGEYNLSGWLFDLSVSSNLHDHYLKPINAYQEYWHSWQTFHPETKK